MPEPTIAQPTAPSPGPLPVWNETEEFDLRGPRGEHYLKALPPDTQAELPRLVNELFGIPQNAYLLEHATRGVGTWGVDPVGFKTFLSSKKGEPLTPEEFEQFRASAWVYLNAIPGFKETPWPVKDRMYGMVMETGDPLAATPRSELGWLYHPIPRNAMYALRWFQKMGPLGWLYEELENNIMEENGRRPDQIAVDKAMADRMKPESLWARGLIAVPSALLGLGTSVAVLGKPAGAIQRKLAPQLLKDVAEKGIKGLTWLERGKLAAVRGFSWAVPINAEETLRGVVKGETPEQIAKRLLIADAAILAAEIGAVGIPAAIAKIRMNPEAYSILRRVAYGKADPQQALLIARNKMVTLGKIINRQTLAGQGKSQSVKLLKGQLKSWEQLAQTAGWTIKQGAMHELVEGMPGMAMNYIKGSAPKGKEGIIKGAPLVKGIRGLEKKAQALDDAGKKAFAPILSMLKKDGSAVKHQLEAASAGIDLWAQGTQEVALSAWDDVARAGKGLGGSINRSRASTAHQLLDIRPGELERWAAGIPRGMSKDQVRTVATIADEGYRFQNVGRGMGKKIMERGHKLGISQKGITKTQQSQQLSKQMRLSATIDDFERYAQDIGPDEYGLGMAYFDLTDLYARQGKEALDFGLIQTVRKQYLPYMVRPGKGMGKEAWKKAVVATGQDMDDYIRAMEGETGQGMVRQDIINTIRKAGFQYKRKSPNIQIYWELAKKHGLEPVYDPFEGAARYTEAFGNVLGAKHAMGEILRLSDDVGQPLIQRSQLAPSTFRELKNDVFARFARDAGIIGKNESAKLAAEPHVAKWLNAAFAAPWEPPKAYEAYLQFKGFYKISKMLNFMIHTWNMATFTLIETKGNPLKVAQVWKRGRDIWKAGGPFRNDDEALTAFLAAGLKVGGNLVDDIGTAFASQPGILGKIFAPAKAAARWNHRVMFGKIVGGLQLGTAEQKYMELMKKGGLNSKDALHAATHFTNIAYGTIPRHYYTPMMYEIGRATLFARDWTVSNIDLLMKSVAKRGMGSATLTPEQLASLRPEFAKLVIGGFAMLHMQSILATGAAWKIRTGEWKWPYELSPEKGWRKYFDLYKIRLPIESSDGSMLFIPGPFGAFMNDILQWGVHPTEVGVHKTDPVIKHAIAQMYNWSEWQHEPLTKPGSSLGRQIYDRSKYVLEDIIPLYRQIKHIATGQPYPGTKDPRWVPSVAYGIGKYVGHDYAGIEAPQAYNWVKQRLDKLKLYTGDARDYIDNKILKGQVLEALEFYAEMSPQPSWQWMEQRLLTGQTRLSKLLKQIPQYYWPELLNEMPPEIAQELAEALAGEGENQEAMQSQAQRDLRGGKLLQPSVEPLNDPYTMNTHKRFIDLQEIKPKIETPIAP